VIKLRELTVAQTEASQQQWRQSFGAYNMRVNDEKILWNFTNIPALFAPYLAKRFNSRPTLNY